MVRADVDEVAVVDPGVHATQHPLVLPYLTVEALQAEPLLGIHPARGRRDAPAVAQLVDVGGPEPDAGDHGHDRRAGDAECGGV